MVISQDLGRRIAKVGQPNGHELQIFAKGACAILMPPGECSDMNGAIRAATECGKRYGVEIHTIQTLAGDRIDTRYGIRDGHWIVLIAGPTTYRPSVILRLAIGMVPSSFK
jgi:hypothetical protein